jgi:hypothetical protein
MYDACLNNFHENQLTHQVEFNENRTNCLVGDARTPIDGCIPHIRRLFLLRKKRLGSKERG